MKTISKLAAALVVGTLALAAPSVADARPLGGAVHKLDIVLANATDTHEVTLVAGRAVTVMAIGDGDTDLDLFVYDPAGNLVGSDTDLTDTCLVKVNPRVDGKYTIKVKNLGRVGNRYALVVK